MIDNFEKLITRLPNKEVFRANFSHEDLNKTIREFEEERLDIKVRLRELSPYLQVTLTRGDSAMYLTGLYNRMSIDLLCYISDTRIDEAFLGKKNLINTMIRYVGTTLMVTEAPKYYEIHRESGHLRIESSYGYSLGPYERK